MELLNPGTPQGGMTSKVVAVILDWAGTAVDFGSLAPVRTLQKVFEEAAVPITESEARKDMGIAKRDHIASLLGMPRIQQSWKTKYGHLPGTAEIDLLYERFIPLQFACLRENSRLIPGTAEVVDLLRSRGLKIGSTTGYTRAMLDVLVEEATQAGYKPDCSFCPEDVGAGRPHPFMIYAAAVAMKVYPFPGIVKVGDTASDVREGLNAGAWSIGVTLTGNAIGLSKSQLDGISPEERDQRNSTARKELIAAGAHYVIDTLHDLPAVVDDIEVRLKAWSSPSTRQL